MEFELISKVRNRGGEPESCRSVVSPRVPWRAGSSPPMATRRFQLPASIASNAHTFARGFSWFAGELRFTGIETRAKCIHKQCLLPSRHNTERHSTSHKIDLDPSERLELP
ncbi:hypothetical protein ALC60_11950 [Trachymyrmex zeteki]|uniref:Uncharacterized protein n=1 Tax=Mycetomoellerius zeteki TaxID=64791 RepID=A0A151WM19_9HYME|nr:hypothetical protein ALC60_11950 [Trachymyrmex zeteki]